MLAILHMQSDMVISFWHFVRVSERERQTTFIRMSVLV